MSSASQGPGWWQASDGNWYPPEQRAGHEAPAPPAPPGSQYPAPGGQGFGNPQTAFAGVVAKTPLGLWLLYAGIAVAVIGLFLPLATVQAGPISVSVGMPGGTKAFLFLFLAAGGALAWATYSRPEGQSRTLIGLSVVIGLLVAHLIYNWFTYDSEMGASESELAGINVSPGSGLILYTLALVFLAVRVVMMWMAQSKPQPQAY